MPKAKCLWCRRRNAVRGIQQLDLQLAVRRDDYTVGSGTTSIYLNGPFFNPNARVLHSSSDFNSSNPTLGLRYRTVKDLMLRASYGASFLPPSFSQLAAQPSSLFAALSDPRRGGETFSAPVISGGNPNLAARKIPPALEAGLVFEPRFIEGLRLALDAYRIGKRNNIAFLGVPVILANEALFPGRVTRGPAPGGTDPFPTVGHITAINASLANITKLHTEGYDLTFEYHTPSFRYGRFDLFALGTLIQKFEQQLAFNTLFVDNVDNVNNNGPLKHRANAALTWKLRGWSVGWATRYFGSYLQLGPPTTTLLNFVARQGSTSIPSQTYHDVWASYKFAGRTGNAPARLSRRD